MEIVPLHCLRCDHRWIPRVLETLPRQCPKCHQSSWNVSKLPCPVCKNRVNKIRKDENMLGFLTCVRSHHFRVRNIDGKRFLIEVIKNVDHKEIEGIMAEIPASVILPEV